MNILTKSIIFFLILVLVCALSASAEAINTRTGPPTGGIDYNANASYSADTLEKIEATIGWTIKSGMLTARGQQTVVAGDDGLIYNFGGFSGGSVMSAVEAYDPAADTWSTKASMPVATRGAAGAKGLDGKIYLFGGYDSYFINPTQIYDPATDTWSLGTPVPSGSGVWYAGAATGDDGKIYVIGGESDAGIDLQLDLVQIYNPVSDTWSSGSPMPTARLGLGVINYNGLIYAIGGFDRSISGAVSTVEVYNPTTDTWMTKASISTPRFEFGIAAGTSNFYAIGGANGSYLSTNEEGRPSEDKIYVMGGSDSYGNNSTPYFDSVEAYNVATNTWSFETSMPTGRRELGSAFVSKVWETAYNTLFDSPSDLELLREYRDEFLTKTTKGKLYTRLLYKHSEKALQVLLANPELMMEANYLIDTNKDAVTQVLNGNEGVIYNTDEIVSFLKAYAKKSPPGLKLLANMIKLKILIKQKQGEPFLGFTLE